MLIFVIFPNSFVIITNFLNLLDFSRQKPTKPLSSPEKQLFFWRKKAAFLSENRFLTVK